jgi:hypothetical protein
MRLGKEQAAGFVEDTEADALPAAEAAEAAAGHAGGMPLATAPEPPLTVS